LHSLLVLPIVLIRVQCHLYRCFHVVAVNDDDDVNNGYDCIVFSLQSWGSFY